MGSIPLYLNQGTTLTLDIDAAQRLRIERAHMPERRIPLHLVSRIVCSSLVNISSGALLACMKRGIPLAIVEPSGKTIGWCFGTRRTENSLRELLRHALDDPTWETHYTQWQDNQRLAISTQVLLLCQVPASAAARTNPRAALCNAHKRKHQQPCGHAVDAIAQLAQHELAAHLGAEAGDPALLAWAKPGLNLINDLGKLLSLQAHIDVHHAQQLPTADKLASWALQRYERHSAHWQQRIAYLSVAFEQFLREHWQ
ncbi:MAG: CRISPR-associated endonuclease Cas1 [Hydrogenophaga sp.]